MLPGAPTGGTIVSEGPQDHSSKCAASDFTKRVTPMLSITAQYQITDIMNTMHSQAGASIVVSEKQCTLIGIAGAKTWKPGVPVSMKGETPKGHQRRWG